MSTAIVNKKSVSVVIVTYNRKNDLLRCIDAVKAQSYKPDNIVVVNNASTDSTETTVTERYGQSVILLNLPENTGGSGGFYTGLKYAHENLKTDLYWLMDDDGFPSHNCLEMLVSESDSYDYIMPASIDIENHEKLSWAVRKRNGKKTEVYQELKNDWGKILDYVTPFNGVLLTKKCVDEVGYINKDFFIWGDDYEHYYRCLQKKINPVTLLDAVFYHPSLKLPLVKICFGLFRVPYADSKLRMTCLIRNYTYIYLHYNQKYKIIIKFLMYSWLFLITRHGDFAGWKLYCASVKDGFKSDFNRHKQFLEKK